MKRTSWPRLLVWTAAVSVATPLAFAGGMMLVPDAPSADETPEALPTAVAETTSTTAVARGDGAGGVRNVTGKEDVRLATYNPTTGKATLAGGTPKVKKGDVIVSGRTKDLPKGALVKVTDPKSDAGGAVSVQPATLPELLGDAKINSATPVSPSDLTVKPLLKGVKAAVEEPAPASPSGSPSVSPSTTPTPAAPASKSRAAAGVVAPAPLPDVPGRHNVGGELRLDLDIPLSAKDGFVPTAQGGPTLQGWVHFQPQVIFTYERDHTLSLEPSKASIGIGGAYDYGWKLHAALRGVADTGRQPLRLPFAEVHVHTTLFVGGFPIVVDADLTYFYQVTADGRISIDSEQKTTGEVALGASYTKGKGWQQLPVATGTTTVGKALRIAGEAEAKATIGAELKVALYGTVGASVEWAPYLRAEVAAEALPKQRLEWALYAGFDLGGSLFVQLKILGISIFEKTFPLPPLNLEWKVTDGELTPEAPVPAARKAA